MQFEMSMETDSGRLDWEPMTEWELGTALTDAMAEAIANGKPLTVMVGRGMGEYDAEAFIVFDPVPSGARSLRPFFPDAFPVVKEIRHGVERVVDAMRDFVDNGV